MNLLELFYPVDMFLPLPCLRRRSFGWSRWERFVILLRPLQSTIISLSGTCICPFASPLCDGYIVVLSGICPLLRRDQLDHSADVLMRLCLWLILVSALPQPYLYDDICVGEVSMASHPCEDAHCEPQVCGLTHDGVGWGVAHHDRLAACGPQLSTDELGVVRVRLRFRLLGTS